MTDKRKTDKTEKAEPDPEGKQIRKEAAKGDEPHAGNYPEPQPTPGEIESTEPGPAHPPGDEDDEKADDK